MLIPRTYRVYELQEKKGVASLVRPSMLSPFDSHEAARTWIETQGCAPAEYCILECFCPSGMPFSRRPSVGSECGFALASGGHAALGAVGALWQE